MGLPLSFLRARLLLLHVTRTPLLYSIICCWIARPGAGSRTPLRPPHDGTLLISPGSVLLHGALLVLFLRFPCVFFFCRLDPRILLLDPWIWTYGPLDPLILFFLHPHPLHPPLSALRPSLLCGAHCACGWVLGGCHCVFLWCACACIPFKLEGALWLSLCSCLCACLAFCMQGWGPGVEWS